MSLNLLVVITTKLCKNCTKLLHGTSFNPQQINKFQCIFATPKQMFHLNCYALFSVSFITSSEVFDPQWRWLF
ncbi:hypothetical protein Syun_029605 [Stephania yunnanensis]|uniref:Uncharacterized protein n=1 Tax=Stephania yunnanensis TaxID=152371 RepID=A0AAP0HK06_9MAGN